MGHSLDAGCRAVCWPAATGHPLVLSPEFSGQELTPRNVPWWGKELNSLRSQRRSFCFVSLCCLHAGRVGLPFSDKICCNLFFSFCSEYNVCLPDLRFLWWCVLYHSVMVLFPEDSRVKMFLLHVTVGYTYQWKGNLNFLVWKCKFLLDCNCLFII